MVKNNMNMQESIRKVLREETSSHEGNESGRHKVFYGFQGIPNFWSDDYDRVVKDSYFDDKDYNDYYFDNFYDMDKEFGHEDSLFGTKGLPVGHPNRSSKSFDMYNDQYGPSIVRVVDERDGINESILREETIKEKYREEYINFHGDIEGFDDNWDNLFNKNFNDGGLMNIPEYIELSRLVNIVGEFKRDRNIHWVRTSDEYLFYDTDWLFLSDVKINDNTKIIRIKTHKSNINLEQTIIQNLTFDYEKEITLKNLDLENYEIIEY